MKKLTFTLLCLVICMCTVVAQNVKVTGTVTLSIWTIFIVITETVL